ncbi:TIGR03943 family putative permease subunit [uncultured Clostridium sp.]|uniref:TIGR03943 family putative permease subunit n=1 Tax=uncultured Clostridium sp. TaxID=59620 RepID=UPI0025D606BD|nr:TIGR03943 family protein [uncultured Clostridium sp.]
MRKFNFDEFMWFIILVFSILGLIYLVYTNKIDSYVGQKMVKYIYSAIILLFIIAVFQIKNIFTPKNSLKLKKKYIPIILALIIGCISVKVQDTFRHRQLNNVLINEYSEKRNKNSEIYNKYQSSIVIDDNNLKILEEIQKFPEDFVGKHIEMSGFVCRESYLKNNQFIVGRIIMTCCAADSKIVGILAEDDEIINLDENEWVTIRGIINYTTINDDEGISHNVPVVIIENMSKKRK